MANELAFHGNEGFPISLIFALANPAAAATTAMLLAQANTGFVVPTGYKFCPMVLNGNSNADLTAGTAIASGPEPALADTVQRATALARAQASPIAAGHIVGVSVVTDAGYLPVTADLDAILAGLLLPA